MSRLLIAAVALFAAASLAACGSDKPSAPKRQAPAPAKKQEPRAEAPDDQPSEHDALVTEYSYTPVGKRDPFRSFFDNFEPVVQRTDRQETCGPLCSWELDQLRLVAVVSGVANPLAMLEDPEGRGHHVRRGSPIGKREGKVTDIRRDKLVVTELLRNAQGQVLPVQTEVPLRGEKDARAGGKDDLVDLSMAR